MLYGYHHRAPNPYRCFTSKIYGYCRDALLGVQFDRPDDSGLLLALRRFETHGVSYAYGLALQAARHEGPGSALDGVYPLDEQS